MRRAMKITVLGLVAAGLGAAGYRYWLARQAQEEGGRIVLHGNVEIRDAQLTFNGSEHVASVLVEEGDVVRPGQVLARLITDRLEAEIDRVHAQIAAQEAVVAKLETGTRPQEIEQARAEVAAAEARVRNAEATVQRLEETVGRGASSAQEVDDARAQLSVERATLNVKHKTLDLAVEGPRVEDIAAARAQLVSLRAELRLRQIQLADSELIAPAAGVIQSRLLEPGDMATPNTPVFTLALQDPKWVRAYVPEPDLGRIRMGQPARVRSDSFPQTAFDGWIGFISPVAEFTPKNVETAELRTRLVYEVRVYVHDTHDQLRLGQPVTVELQAATAAGDGAPQSTAPASRPAAAPTTTSSAP